MHWMVHIGAIAVSFLFVVMMFHIQIAEIHEAARNRRSKRALVHNGLGEGGRNSGQGTRKSKNEWLKGLMSESERSEEQFLNTDNMMPQEKRTAERVEQEVILGRRQKSMNLVQSILKEDKQLGLKKRKKDFVHLLLIRNNTFVTVTDARGNKKTGASTGCLKEFKGRSRRSRYAAKATAEHVGRSARNLGMKSVVMKVKGSTYFRKKKAVILSWREGYTFAECKRSKGVRDPSKIMYIRDVTQLPHNGCRLPRKRRVQIVPRSSPFSLDNNSGKNLTRREGSTRASALRLLRRASALAFFFLSS